MCRLFVQGTIALRDVDTVLVIQPRPDRQEGMLRIFKQNHFFKILFKGKLIVTINLNICTTIAGKIEIGDLKNKSA